MPVGSGHSSEATRAPFPYLLIPSTGDELGLPGCVHEDRWLQLSKVEHAVYRVKYMDMVRALKQHGMTTTESSLQRYDPCTSLDFHSCLQ